jgi:uncharacterized protein YkwD
MRSRGTARVTKVLLLVALVGALVGAAAPGATAVGRTRDRDGMYELTNDSRAHRGLRSLDLHRRMSELARKHSLKMAAQGDLFHTLDPVGAYLGGRPWHVWGENVGVTGGSLEDVQDAFMSSTPHRNNILHRGFRDVAIGVASVDGALWVTVFFYG